MNDIDIYKLIVWLLAIAGAIVTIGGATAVLKRWWTNSKAMKNTERINNLDLRVGNVETKTNELESHQRDTDDFTKIMCNSMLALLNHAITGSSIEKLQEAQEEIKQYLINK